MLTEGFMILDQTNKKIAAAEKLPLAGKIELLLEIVSDLALEMQIAHDRLNSIEGGTD